MFKLQLAHVVYHNHHVQYIYTVATLCKGQSNYFDILLDTDPISLIQLPS